MKNNWIVTSIISGILGGLLTLFLTQDWQISIICSFLIFVIVLVHNPKTRYLKAFYITLLPMLSRTYFNISVETEQLDIKAGLKDLNDSTNLVLGSIAVLCLILDYLERKGKLGFTIFSIKKNSVGNIDGNRNKLNQNNG